jgi:hypothetical protein
MVELQQHLRPHDVRAVERCAQQPDGKHASVADDAVALKQRGPRRGRCTSILNYQ